MPALSSTAYQRIQTTRAPTNAVVINAMDLEPIDEWKANVRKRIEGDLAPKAKDAKDQLQANIRSNPEEENWLRAEYQRIMDDIRRLAKEQFQEELERERQERRWAAGMSWETDWIESPKEEQEVIYPQIKQSEKVSDGGPQERAAERRRWPQTVPEPSWSSSQRAPKSSSQRWGSKPHALAQPTSTSSPHGHQESLRKSAEKQLPSLPTRTPTEQAAGGSSMSKSPCSTRGAPRMADHFTPSPRPAPSSRPTPSPRLTPSSHLTPSPRPTPSPRLVPSSYLTPSPHPAPSSRPLPSQTPAPPFPESSACSLPRPIDPSSAITPPSEQHTTMYSRTGGLGGIASSPPPPQIWMPSEDQAYQPTHFTSASTSTVNKMSSSPCTRPLLATHRRDGSAGMRSITSAPPALASGRRSSRKHANPPLADHQEYDEELYDVMYKPTPADAVGPTPRSDSSDYEQPRAKKKKSVKFRRKNGPTNAMLDREPVQYGPPPRINGNGLYRDLSTRMPPYSAGGEPIVPKTKPPKGFDIQHGWTRRPVEQLSADPSYTADTSPVMQGRSTRKRRRCQQTSYRRKEESFEQAESDEDSARDDDEYDGTYSDVGDEEIDVDEEERMYGGKQRRERRYSSRRIKSHVREKGMDRRRTGRASSGPGPVPGSSYHPPQPRYRGAPQGDSDYEYGDHMGRDGGDRGRYNYGERGRQRALEREGLMQSESVPESDCVSTAYTVPMNGESTAPVAGPGWPPHSAPEVTAAQTARRPMPIAPKNKILHLPPNIPSAPPRPPGTSAAVSARDNQLQQEGFRRRALEIEEKRKLEDLERQRAEREREGEAERIERAREEEWLERVRKEQEEARRLDIEREQRRLQNKGKALPARATSVRVTNLERSKVTRAPEGEERFARLRREQEEARRLNEEREHIRMLKEAQQELDTTRPAVMRPELGEAANSRLGGPGKTWTNPASSISPYRTPVSSSWLASSTSLLSSSIDGPSSIEQHNMGERRERERVPVSMLELTKQWKAALKSRIDEEIGVLVQLNTRWFEENISKVKDDDQLHLQTELENVTRSLDLLRNLSSEMFSGDVAEMVILVEREPKGEQEAAAIDTAGKVRREYGEKGAATCVERPGLKKEPQVIDRGRREENFESPEIEPGTDAGRLVARDAQEPAEDIENSAASTREPAKDAGNGEEMQWETLKDVSTPRPQGGTQEASPFANAQRFTIHHATFITSETANFSTPAHATNAQIPAARFNNAEASAQQQWRISQIIEALCNSRSPR